MLREIVLDTETTGLDAASDEIIEIGCVEVYDRRVTGRTYHQYIRPQGRISAGAEAVHGLSNEMLASQPRFAEIADAFLEFVADAQIVIHNAEFDSGFLASEFARIGRAGDWPPAGPIVDSLLLARSKHPGQRNSLDALCKRYEVDNSGRDLHGALLDSELLAEVYLRLTGGQNEIDLAAPTLTDATGVQRSVASVLERAGARPARAIIGDEAAAAHAAFLERLRAAGECLWPQQEDADANRAA